MALRQIEVVIPNEGQEVIETLLVDDYVKNFWQDSSELQSGHLIKVLVDASETEKFLDKAEELLGNLENYRLVMLPIEATLPRIDREEEREEEDEEEPEEEESKLQGPRVSREELYTDISDGVNLNSVYMAMVLLSTIVAAAGLLRDNTAVVIGAMVIAPLLAPNVGLALSVVLADSKLGLKSFKTAIAGLGFAMILSIIFGLLVDVNLSSSEIISRTEVNHADIALALASGAAGVLAYTIGMSAAVIGVMVAVALLPPLVATGLLLGSMEWEPAFYAFLLLTTNVICVNLAAVATLMLQGIRPRTWYETKKARRFNQIALTFWFILLIVLAVVIYMA